MLFKGNSSRLELLIGKIQAHKEPSQEEQHKSQGMNTLCSFFFHVIAHFLSGIAICLKVLSFS